MWSAKLCCSPCVYNDVISFELGSPYSYSFDQHITSVRANKPKWLIVGQPGLWVRWCIFHIHIHTSIMSNALPRTKTIVFWIKFHINWFFAVLIEKSTTLISAPCHKNNRWWLSSHVCRTRPSALIQYFHNAGGPLLPTLFIFISNTIIMCQNSTQIPVIQWVLEVSTKMVETKWPSFCRRHL